MKPKILTIEFDYTFEVVRVWYWTPKGQNFKLISFIEWYKHDFVKPDEIIELCEKY